MSVKNILRPSKEKILLDLLLSVAWLILVFTVPGIGFEKMFSGMDASAKLFVGALNLAVFLVLYYPLSCGIAYLYRNLGRKGTGSRNELIIALLLVLVFNPVTFSLIIIGYNQLNTHVLNKPCGLEVTGFSDASPAKASGMSIGEIIVSMDGQTIDTQDSFMKALSDKRAGDTVSLKTDKGEYNVVLASSPDPQRAMAGVSVKQKLCSN